MFVYFGSVLMRRWNSRTNIGSVRSISLQRLVSVLCIMGSLTYIFYDGAPYPAFMFGLLYVHEGVSAINIGRVSVTLSWSFVSL